MPKKAAKKKKSVEKKVSKKKTTKKATKKKAAPKKVLKDAPSEQYFILCNGQPVKNIKELADVIEELRDDVFSHHVAPDKNDFATWVNDVFKEISLAKQLAGVKDKDKMRIVLYKHVIKKLS